MLSVVFLLGIVVLGHASPISDATSGAQDQAYFAQNLLTCIEKEKSNYNEATKMFSGDAVTNESVNNCLVQSLEELRPYMSTGIDSLHLKPTDPLMIDNLALYREVPPFTIQTTLDNVEVRGLSKFKTRKVAADLKNKSLQMVITVPNLYIKGQYKTDSILAVVTVKGEGPFTANLTKVTGDGRAEINAVCKTINGIPGQKILVVKNAAFDFNIAKTSMKLENLFPGKKALAKVAQEFLNSEEFIEMVKNEVKPQILTEVNQLFEEVMNSALAQFPVNDYLEDLGHSVEC